MIDGIAEPKVTYTLKILAIFALCVALLIAGVEFLKLLGSGGVVILAAILVTYLIMPLVLRFRKQMPMIWALLLTYAILALIIVFAILVVVPPLAAQAHSLIESLPKVLQTLQRQLSDPHNALVMKTPVELRGYVTGLPAEINTLIAKYGLVVAQQALSVVFSLFSLFLSVIIVPILAMYLFFDTPDVKRGFLGFIPPRARPKTLAILSDVNHVIGAFVRGQVLDGVILAVMVTLMLWILHVPYALLIGVAAGFLNLVPYLGAIIGFIPSVLLALVYNDWKNAVMVAILFAVIQQVDGNLILPRIMKENVLLSPLVIIIAILVFSALFGVMGTFLAVPVAAMMRVLKLHFTPAPSPAQMLDQEAQARALQVFSTPRAASPEHATPTV
ncbi:MAG: AI-2E family transporter [Candidatus Eremiobacteraeota bacterium]|nr:AI-2E family transporter [Candidatus Eremiobacteraeota bacterium]